MDFNALVAHPAHVLWLNVTERRKRYLADYGCTLLGFLPAGIAGLEVEDGDLEVGEKSCLQGPTTSDVVFLIKFVLHMS